MARGMNGNQYVWDRSHVSDKNTLAGIFTALLLATGAQAATDVDVELSLLIDVSGSVDTTEFNLQRQGYVDAFMNSGVISAILSDAGGRLGKIAVEVVYWSSSNQQDQVVGWTLLDSAGAISNFASAVATAARTSDGLTGLGSALKYAADSINTNDFDGKSKVIDVSGDGLNNSGVTADVRRDYALSNGIDRINGIAIEGDFIPGYADLTEYYKEQVIGGTNAFALTASSFDTFGAAIQQKLKAEITGETPAVPVSATGLLLLTAIGGIGAMRRRRS